MKKLTVFLMLAMFMVASCMTMQSRPDMEKDLIAKITVLQPYAKQFYEARDNGNREKMTNLAAIMAPYYAQTRQAKINYCQKYGDIEYNNLLKTHKLEWGIGLFW